MSGPQRKKVDSWNPIAFVPAQVSFISIAAYIALFAVLLWVHTSVPSAPSTAAPAPAPGINLTEAWRDLDYITDGYHPWISRRNGEVREYLIHRIENILKHNGVRYKVVEQKPSTKDEIVAEDESGSIDGTKFSASPKDVVVFKDGRSNATFVDAFHVRPWTLYGESENILVYIRGTSDDEAEDWWEPPSISYKGAGGVLVNAHYDSVSSGFGATDDGVGVVTVLQLISHFTTEGYRPKRGIVALLNQGEEDGLYGAYNYVRNPLSKFAHTFLNLEGAGAGGRAMLFRSTDAEVTNFYAGSPNPFGSVVSADGFKRGFIRSGTDYSIFVDYLGLRGLDLAFFEPRSRYHTTQDDARDTSSASLWHMLSASLVTLEAMVKYDGSEFDGDTDKTGKFQIGSGSVGVWFDLFGQTFAVMRLHTLFALSVTLLTVGPIALGVLQFFITRKDRWYLLTRRQRPNDMDDAEPVHFSGMRGILRFPIAVVIASSATFGLAYLQAKMNPLILYSSEYSVWAMMLSAWFSVAWFFLAGADRIRPTALHRMYSLIWMYALTWVLLVIATIGENDLKIASSYMIVIYHATVFVSLLVSYLELLGLPSKEEYIQYMANLGIQGSGARLQHANETGRTRASSMEASSDVVNENTSLLRRSASNRAAGTFTGVADRRQSSDEDADTLAGTKFDKAYGEEQAWSSLLPQWTWIVQFLVLGPINIILIGQVSLLITAAVRMTPADGNAVLPLYLMIAALSILLLLPMVPFLHRFKYQIPTVLVCIFIGCLLYNLFAFPFSRNARMKFFFQQRVDLDTGANLVSLQGVDGFIQDVAGAMPSAGSHQWSCTHINNLGRSAELLTCRWPGLAPNVMAEASYNASKDFDSWMDYNVSSVDNKAIFQLRGRNTKSCRIAFDNPVAQVDIADAATDPRFESLAENGSERVLLFGRTWDETFHVNVSWPLGTAAKGQSGEVACIWADANDRGTIPAFDEVLRFAPVWSIPTKFSDGLVEGYRKFKL